MKSTNAFIILLGINQSKKLQKLKASTLAELNHSSNQNCNQLPGLNIFIKIRDTQIAIVVVSI
ncbi:MAG: hypothetical protein P1U46_03870 [Patescibacteria group bacterium]|nr:hypothetical protein [Patescibacteria group bacterium]